MRTIHSEASMHELEAMIDYLETKVERLEAQLEAWMYRYEDLLNQLGATDA